MLHRCGAMFYLNVVIVHRLPPFLTLMLLLKPAETTATLRGFCEKMLDEHTASFMKLYGEDVTAMDALIELLVFVVFGKTTTVHWERINARPRKALISLSNQTKRPNVSTLNCIHVVAQMQRREQNVRTPAGSNRGQKRRSAQNTNGLRLWAVVYTDTTRPQSRSAVDLCGGGVGGGGGGGV